MTKPTNAEIWQTFSAKDCSDFTEEKMGLTYLSWAHAWGVLMEHYPDASFTVEERFLDNGTVESWVTVLIGDCSRTMWLPCMNHKNQAIVNPTTRDISDCRMRALTKCLALYGLGHYIYAGEDLPKAVKDAPITDEQAQVIQGMLMELDDNGIKRFLKWIGAEKVNEIRAVDFERAVAAVQKKLQQPEVAANREAASS